MPRLPEADGHPAKDERHPPATDNRSSPTNTQPSKVKLKLGRKKFCGGVRGGPFKKRPPRRFSVITREQPAVAVDGVIDAREVEGLPHQARIRTDHRLTQLIFQCLDHLD